MEMYTLKADAVAKKFTRKHLFKNINIAVSISDSLCIKGPNGSGKSTLLKILACQLKPTQGSVTYLKDEVAIEEDAVYNHVGFLSPHIEPYGELTAVENMEFIRKKAVSSEQVQLLLEKFGLMGHGNERVKFFSSGLKQRLKYLLSIINDPPVLLLDEPGTNLDSSGKNILYSHIASIAQKKIIILASNDSVEEKLCNGVLSLYE